MLDVWKKSYDKSRQHIKNQRHYFDNKGPCNQSHGLSSSHVWMWDWTIKKTECWRTDFELWCWRRLLRFLWTTRKSGQLILREIDPECHPTISSSVVPFFSHLQTYPALGSFPVSQFFASGDQSIEVSDSVWVLTMNIQDWIPLGLTGLFFLK